MGVAGLLTPTGLGSFIPCSWNPDKYVIDAVTQEITDAHKDLGYIRTLEAKLKGKKPGDKDTKEEDFEMLSNMKKDMGIDPGYETPTEKREEERAKNAGYDPKEHEEKKSE